MKGTTARTARTATAQQASAKDGAKQPRSADAIDEAASTGEAAAKTAAKQPEASKVTKTAAAKVVAKAVVKQPAALTANQRIVAAAGAGPRFWLMKSEPETFSIDDLERLRRTPWEGVRNYQARNHMRDDMRIGDLVLFYHSNTTPPGVVGLATVLGAPYPDVTAFDPASPYFDACKPLDQPRWMLVDVGFIEKFLAPVPLEAMRDDPALQGMLLTQKGQRLSVQPVLRTHFEHIAARAGSTRAAALLARC